MATEAANDAVAGVLSLVPQLVKVYFASAEALALSAELVVGAGSNARSHFSHSVSGSVVNVRQISGICDQFITLTAELLWSSRINFARCVTLANVIFPSIRVLVVWKNVQGLF